MTRVFEDLDLPGLGQPHRVVVDLTLVDAGNRSEVLEAYHDGRTIIGSVRAPVDGTSAQWYRQGMARAQWVLDLAPNNEITYGGSPGGTLYRRTVESQASGRHNKIKKTVSYIEVPESPEMLIFGDLVVPFDVAPLAPDYIWIIGQGDDWNRTMTIDTTEGTDPEDYTFELELRRSVGAAVVAEADFDYTYAAVDGTVGMRLPSEVTATLLGNYISKLQQFVDDNRTTIATWAFVVTRDA